MEGSIHGEIQPGDKPALPTVTFKVPVTCLKPGVKLPPLVGVASLSLIVKTYEPDGVEPVIVKEPAPVKVK